MLNEQRVITMDQAPTLADLFNELGRRLRGGFTIPDVAAE